MILKTWKPLSGTTQAWTCRGLWTQTGSGIAILKVKRSLNAIVRIQIQKTRQDKTKSPYFKVGSNVVELRVTADRFGSFRLADGVEHCPLAAVFVLLKQKPVFNSLMSICLVSICQWWHCLVLLCRMSRSCLYSDLNDAGLQVSHCTCSTSAFVEAVASFLVWTANIVTIINNLNYYFERQKFKRNNKLCIYFLEFLASYVEFMTFFSSHFLQSFLMNNKSTDAVY